MDKYNKPIKIIDFNDRPLIGIFKGNVPFWTNLFLKVILLCFSQGFQERFKYNWFREIYVMPGL